MAGPPLRAPGALELGLLAKTPLAGRRNFISSIEANATKVLEAACNEPTDKMGMARIGGERLQQITGLEPAAINDAVTLLQEAGLVTWMRSMGTAPFVFFTITPAPRGRYELERMKKQESSTAQTSGVSRPLNPLGSPYGFTDRDWETVSSRRKAADDLFVVLGLQFNSQHYNTNQLAANLKSDFERAVAENNKGATNPKVKLVFTQLTAGYGEHLFNEIARDIISADIAVFETSDLNPNVMIEMGVALTWGVRVLPIRLQGRPVPPSDISGQTWAEYVKDGAPFVDPDHARKLAQMVERAARKKGP